MFLNEAERRMMELQSRSFLTPGEELELKHLIELKYRSPASAKPDFEALKRAVKAAAEEQKRREKLQHGQ